MRPPSARARVLAGFSGLVLLLLGQACRAPSDGGGQAATATPAVAALRSAARSLPGLRFDSFQEYAGERLYDYMDGAAVTYLDHHVRVLAACDVFRGQTQAMVEVYDMSSASDAAAVFQEFSGSSGQRLEVGEAGCYWLGSGPEGIFHRGRFFVRVLAFAADADLALALIREVAAGLDRAVLRR